MRRFTRKAVTSFVLAVAVLSVLMISCATRETPTSNRSITPRMSEAPSRMVETTGTESHSQPRPEFREEEYRERLKSLLQRHDRGDDTASIALVGRDEELQREIQYFKDHRVQGASVIESIVRTLPVVPDLSVMTGVPQERYREFMRGTKINPNHPDAEAFIGALARNKERLGDLIAYEEEEWLFTRACIVAGEVGYTWMGGFLYQALGHESPTVFCVAAEGLASMGERRAVPASLKLAEAEKEAFYLVRLIGVLGLLGKNEDIPRIQALQERFDQNGDVRVAISSAVALIESRAKDGVRRRLAE